MLIWTGEDIDTIGTKIEIQLCSLAYSRNGFDKTFTAATFSNELFTLQGQ